MRINFGDTYKDLQRLIQAKTLVERSGSIDQRFGPILSDISPDRAQHVEVNKQFPGTGAPAANTNQSDSGPMASYKFAPPDLKSPVFEALGSANLAQELVNPSPQGVKTPALLEARRIDGAEPLSSQILPETANSVPRVETKLGTEDLKRLVLKAGQKHGVNPVLGLAVASAESSFNPRAVSSDGMESKGLFQLLDSTGSDLLKRAGYEVAYDPFNPELNVDLGVGYLRYLHQIFSQSTLLPNKLATEPAANSASLEKLAVAAYNAGEGRVASAQSRAKQAGADPSNYESIETYLPDSTREYVRRVLRTKDRYEGLLIG